MTQASYLFTPPGVPSLPIRGRQERYPVNRIFCVGRNYHAHALEMGAPVDKASAVPFYFTKSASTLVQSEATVPYPCGTANYHFEMELVVAIGSPGFRVDAAAAATLVYGYGAGLDMTRRDLQLVAREQGRPWDLGKDFEQSAVCSAIVPRAATGDLERGAIELCVNGARRQASELSRLIWSVPELIADLSRFYHLQQGDLIYTGTPDGVGAVHPGDRLVGRVEGVGEVILSIGAAE